MFAPIHTKITAPNVMRNFQLPPNSAMRSERRSPKVSFFSNCFSMSPCTDYLVRRRRAPPSTSLNQPISLTLPLGTLRKWRGELPRGPVLARFCRFDLESTNVDPKLLRDGRSGSSSRTFARAGSSQSRTQRRNMDFVGGLEHRDSCGIGGDRGVAFRRAR